jgi:hypothetical protein
MACKNGACSDDIALLSTMRPTADAPTKPCMQKDKVRFSCNTDNRSMRGASSSLPFQAAGSECPLNSNEKGLSFKRRTDPRNISSIKRRLLDVHHLQRACRTKIISSFFRGQQVAICGTGLFLYLEESTVWSDQASGYVPVVLQPGYNAQNHLQEVNE